METNDSVLCGIAKCLWAMAWADAMEEHGQGRSLSGCDIYDIMPEVPDAVYLEAAKIYGRVEQLCGMYIPALVHAAARAEHPGMPFDDVSELIDSEYSERFGQCIAYSFVGDGVRWTDDHADFETNLSFASLGVGESLMWGDVRFYGETPCEVRDAAEAVVSTEYPRPTEHYVYGSGMIGCLYDNGPHQALTQHEAISSLCESFSDLPLRELRAMRRNLRADGIHYFTTHKVWDADGAYARKKADRTHSARMLAGADYCDVSRHDGPPDDLED